MPALPLPSARIFLALRDANCIELVEGAVPEITRRDGETIVTVTQEDTDGANESFQTEHCYRLFVDCSGQNPTEIEDDPFPSLVTQGRVRRARVGYASPAQAEKRKNLENDSKLGEFDGRSNRSSTRTIERRSMISIIGFVTCDPFSGHLQRLVEQVQIHRFDKVSLKACRLGTLSIL